MHIALFQPDIAANVAATIRLCACLDVPLLVIEPCGFVWNQRRLRRVGLDYLRDASVERFASWATFEAWRRASGGRVVLLTARAERPHHRVAYRADDVLLVGRESSGIPDPVQLADLCVRVPMAPGWRVLNVVTALAIVLGEALRQTDGFAPQPTRDDGQWPPQNAS